MWDYVPTRFLPCRRRGDAASVGCGRNGWDRVDPSPRDQQSDTCWIRGISELDERLTFRHVASQEAPDRHRTVNAPSGDRSSSDGRCKLIKSDKDRTADLHRNSGARDRIIMIVQPAVNHDRTAQTKRGRTLRSSRDRAAIAARSSRDRGAIEPRSYDFRGGIALTWLDADRRRPKTTIESRSWPDRGSIVVRSWR